MRSGSTNLRNYWMILLNSPVIHRSTSIRMPCFQALNKGPLSSKWWQWQLPLGVCVFWLLRCIRVRRPNVERGPILWTDTSVEGWRDERKSCQCFRSPLMSSFAKWEKFHLIKIQFADVNRISWWNSHKVNTNRNDACSTYIYLSRRTQWSTWCAVSLLNPPLR